MHVFSRAKWCIAIVCALALALVPVLLVENRPLRTLDHGVYVWQRVWDDALAISLEKSRDLVDVVMLNAGEVHAREGRPVFAPVPVRWEWLAGRASVPVIRIYTSAAGDFSAPDLERVAHALAEGFRLHRAAAAESGVTLEQFQIDFDCPTRRLSEYVRLIEMLRGQLDGTGISITALPAWLASGSFGRLAGVVDWYVLQVHMLERPRSATATPTIWSPERVAGYVKACVRVGRPFRVALPTYACDVLFDADGAWIGLESDGTRQVWPQGVVRRAAETLPEDALRVSNALRRVNNQALRGVVWYRLPIAQERYNWTWTTFQAVLSGRLPQRAYSAVIDTPQAGLYEVHVHNAGETRDRGCLFVTVEWEGAGALAWDVLGEFQSAEKPTAQAMQFTGPPPQPGESLPVAWFRLGPSDGGNRDHARVRGRVTWEAEGRR